MPPMDHTVRVRPAQDADAEPISKLVQKTVRISNAQDYSASVIERVAENFSAETVRGFLLSRVVLVACRGATILGTASLDRDVVRTVFVSPEAQGQGIGQQLMEAVEAIAVRGGVAALQVPATLTAKLFYARLGYREVREVSHGEERTVVMAKILRDGLHPRG